MTDASTPLEGTPMIAPSTTDHPLYPEIVQAIQSVYDPEIPVNIYDLGLIYTIVVKEDSAVEIIMTLTAPGCPVAGEMPGWVADAVEPLPGVKQVDVEMVFEPQWGMEMRSESVV